MTSRRISQRISGIISLLTLTAFGLIPLEAAHAASCHFYAITLQGTASIGDSTSTSSAQQFLVGQYAMWRDRGVRTHQIEFVLTTLQDLNASAQVGHIELMTNSAFARNAGISAAQYDMATLSVSNAVSFQLDSGMSFVLPPPNVFVAPGIGTVPGGLGGLGFLPGAGGQLGEIINSTPLLTMNYFYPRMGGGSFSFTDSNFTTIVGTLDLVGTGIDNTSYQARYQANFSGSFIGSVQCG